MDKKLNMPLDGIRVLDLSAWQMGPVAARMLASLGAEVIKIENPEGGDPCRGFQSIKGISVRHKGGRSIHQEMYNSDKKGITLNLKTEKGLEVLIRLVRKSDVFLTNLAYRSLRKMGLDYEALAKENPKLIYARANGFGFKGPDADIPSMDVLGQARGGNMYLLTFKGEEPRYAVGGICDQAGAFILAYGIVTALYARERYGIGQMVETSQLGAMIKLVELAVSGYCLAGHPWPNEGREDMKNPLWNWYKCKDGRWIVFAHLRSDPFWKDFATALGLEHLIEDPKFEDHATREKNCRELIEIIEQTMIQRTSQEWAERFKKFPRVSYSHINQLSDLPSDPQILANEYLVDVDHPLAGQVKMVGLPLQFSKTPAQPFRFVAPELGQHTEEVLTDLAGYTWDEVTQLRDEGVI
jgi:crotonobetainyl-CoA:carnitine CoA-transferase CaiB-like acyl-CoA transferase